MQNRFPLKQWYQCMTRGCPNKAASYNESVQHTYLFCKFHREEYFNKLDKENELKKMFTSTRSPAEEEIDLASEMSYSFQAKKILETLKKWTPLVLDDTDLIEDVKLITIDLNFIFKELRLFFFYKKLAHFQCPSIEFIRPYMTKNILYEDLTYIIDYIKQILLTLLLNPLLEDIRFHMIKYAKKMYIDFPKFKITRKCKHYHMIEILALRMLTNNQRIFKYASLFYVFRYPMMVEQFMNPELLVLAKNKKDLEINEKKLQVALWPKFGRFFQFKNFSYYREAAMGFYKLGMYYDALRCLKKIEESEIIGMLKLTPAQKTRFSFDKGLVYFYLSLYERALISFKEYLKSLEDPMKDSYSQCFLCVVYSLAKLGKITEALEFANKVIEARPKIKLNEAKAFIYLETTRYAESERENGELWNRIKFDLNLRKSPIYGYSPHLGGRLQKMLFMKYLTHFYRGKFTFALEYCERHYYRLLKRFGDSHPILAEMLNYLALMHEKLGNYHKALSYLKNAWKIEEKIYAKNSDVSIETLVRMGHVYLAIEKEEMAKRCMRIMLRIRKKYHMTAETCPGIYVVVAKYFKTINEFERAYKFLNKVRHTERYVELRKHAKDHPKIIEMDIEIASVVNLLDISDYYYQNIIKAYKCFDEYRHPNFYYTILLSAQTYMSFGYWEVAQAILTKAIYKAELEIKMGILDKNDVSRYVFLMKCLKQIIDNNLSTT